MFSTTIPSAQTRDLMVPPGKSTLARSMFLGRQPAHFIPLAVAFDIAGPVSAEKGNRDWPACLQNRSATRKYDRFGADCRVSCQSQGEGSIVNRGLEGAYGQRWPSALISPFLSRHKLPLHSTRHRVLACRIRLLARKGHGASCGSHKRRILSNPSAVKTHEDRVANPVVGFDEWREK